MDIVKKGYAALETAVGEVPAMLISLALAVGAVKLIAAGVDMVAPGWGEKVKGVYRV